MNEEKFVYGVFVDDWEPQVIGVYLDQSTANEVANAHNRSHSGRYGQVMVEAIPLWEAADDLKNHFEKVVGVTDAKRYSVVQGYGAYHYVHSIHDDYTRALRTELNSQPHDPKNAYSVWEELGQEDTEDGRPPQTL